MKRHIQRIIQGRPSYFMEKSVQMDTNHLREGKKLHCALLSSRACNASTHVATIQVMLLHPKVFIDALWVCIFTLHVWFVQKTAGVQLKHHEADTLLWLLSFQKGKNQTSPKQNHYHMVCEFIPMTTSPHNHDRGSKI